MKKYLFAAACLLSISAHSQDGRYKCYIKNMVQNSATQLTFDICMTTENSKNFQLHAVQAGIDFDYDAIVNGGKLSAAIVANSSQVKIINTNTVGTGIKIDENSKQLRIAALIAPISNDFSKKKEIKIGTFKITNTVPFTDNVRPNFSWYTGNADAAHSKNVVLEINKAGKAILATSLMDHKIENPDFLLRQGTTESHFVAFENQGSIHFHSDSLVEGIAEIELFDMMGSLVTVTSLKIESGQYDFAIERKSINSGIYIVKVNNNGNSYTTKIKLK